MPRLKGWVEYEGGDRGDFACGTTVLVAWERYCRRQGIKDPYDQANGQTCNHFVAYTALGIAEGFDVWLASVVDCEVEEAEVVDPTPAGASLE